MPTLTIREVTLSWAQGRRRHQNGGLTDLYAPQSGPVTAGDQPPIPPPAAQIGGKFFSLMTIGGGTGAPVIYTAADLAANHPVPAVTVGANDINAVSIYLAPGGLPGGDPGVFLDAFDITNGRFIDEDFVTITTNGSANVTLSASVNYDGIIDTKNIAATVVDANNGITSIVGNTPVNQSFNTWQSLSGTEAVTGRDLTVAANSSAYYLALYTIVNPPSVNKQNNNYAIWQWVDYATMVDGNPHIPMGPELAGFEAAIAFASNANFFDEKLRGEVNRIAAAQVTLSAQAISNKIQGTTAITGRVIAADVKK
jgi:hypothetical protein